MTCFMLPSLCAIPGSMPYLHPSKPLMEGQICMPYRIPERKPVQRARTVPTCVEQEIAADFCRPHPNPLRAKSIGEPYGLRAVEVLEIVIRTRLRLGLPIGLAG